jgi:uncharacterized spore protein YtfJ
MTHADAAGRRSQTEVRKMTQTVHPEAGVMEAVREVVDKASAERVFGAPVSQDGLTVLPVAKVGGGGGGGGGTSPTKNGTDTGGAGGGVGISAKPLGVFVIKDGKVGWRPAIDINKVIVGGQIVAIVALLTVRALIKARGRQDRP